VSRGRKGIVSSVFEVGVQCERLSFQRGFRQTWNRVGFVRCRMGIGICGMQGRMLARATEKLKLEKVIITGGNFKQNSDDRSALSAKDLLELITQDETKDGEAQSAEVSDADLQQVMCRLDLEGKKAPYPMVGPGWEVVVDGSSSSLLGGVA
jgi:hypothetical protein